MRWNRSRVGTFGERDLPGEYGDHCSGQSGEGNSVERFETRVDSQGQVSIPAPVRRKLGLTPGSRVEWCVQGGEVIVRRTDKYTSRDIHDALFVTPPARQTVDDMKDGIRTLLARKHAPGPCYDAKPPRRGG